MVVADTSRAARQGMARIVLPAIMLLAAVFRLRGLDWDDGHLFHPDERNIISAALSLHAPDGLVPSFHAYNGLALYLPRMLAELGAWVLRSGSVDAAALAMAARFLSAVSSLLAVAVIFQTARLVGLAATAWFAAFVMACMPAAIQAAHFGTTESALVLVVAMLGWLSCRHVELNSRPWARSIFYGLVLGIGLGFKTTAAAFGLVVLLAYLFNRATSTLWRMMMELALAGTVAILLLCLTTPQIVFDTQAYLSTMVFEGQVVRGEADVFWTFQFNGMTSGLFEVAQLPWLLGPAAAMLIFPGLLMYGQSLARGDRNAVKLLPLLATSCVYAAIIFTWHAKFIRYLLPLLPVFAVLAAVVFANVRSTLHPVAKALLCVMVLVPGLRQSQLYVQPDPRLAAWAWLAPQILENDLILVEPRDIGAPFANGRAANYKSAALPLIDPTSASKLQKMAAFLEEGDWMIVNSRRHSHVLPRLAGRFPEMCGYYKLLFGGGLGYALAAEFRRDGSAGFRALDPSSLAEETYSVFDAPTVYIFRNARKMSGHEIAQNIEALSCMDNLH